MRVNIKEVEEFLKLKDNTIRSSGVRTNGYKLVMNKFFIGLKGF